LPYYDGSAYPRSEGDVRALVVWVRFADDVRVYVEPATEAAADWLEPDGLPTFSDRVISPTAEDPSGLTEYFLEQSAGRLRLTGRSFPDVVVSADDESEYRRPNGTLDQARLTREIVAQIDADPRVDLTDFDADFDGFVDYLFVVIRSMHQARLYPSHAAGVSDLGYTSEEPEWAGQTLQINQDASGSYIRYDSAGNIFPRIDLVRLMAHELGHDLWRDYVHLRPVAPAPGIPPFAERQVGYVLMAGNSDSRGDETISAYERDLLGWIDCKPLTADTTVLVRDLYSAGAENCYTYQAPAGGRQQGRRIYLSARYRVGPYDRLLTNRSPAAASDQGLMDTGLLVMATEPGGRTGPVPRDQQLVLSNHAADYSGDLFQPGDRLTPWTRPNSSGYLTFPLEGNAWAKTSQKSGVFAALHVLEAPEEDAVRLRFTRDDRIDTVFGQGDVIPALPGLRFSGMSRVQGQTELLGNAHFELLSVESTLDILGVAIVEHLVLEPGATVRVSGLLSVDHISGLDRGTVIVETPGRIQGDAAKELLDTGTP
jgi:M6 family metalloprotease-like protein